MTLAAIVAVAGLIGTPAAWAQNYSWGVFRENVPNAPDDQRNCWTQAMVSGGTINGELLSQSATQQQAEAALQLDARKGLCASQRTTKSWSARQERDTDPDWTNHDWSRHNGSNTTVSTTDGSSNSGSTTGVSNPGP
jgi:hypothetical protein